VFDLIASVGDVARGESELAFNLGVGMVAVVPPSAATAALELLTDRGVPAWALGRVEAGERAVDLVGDYEGPAATWR
jgi:phosphoribosylformylglycinamidine cyclo-ligase